MPSEAPNVSRARTAYPSTLERSKPGSASREYTGPRGRRPPACASATVSIGVRCEGRNSASASETALTVKNSRPAVVIGVSAGRGRALKAKHAHHRPERDLPQPADRCQAQRFLELVDSLVDVVRAATVLERLGQDDVSLVGPDAAGHALAARLVAEEAQHVRRGGKQGR